MKSKWRLIRYFYLSKIVSFQKTVSLYIKYSFIFSPFSDYNFKRRKSTDWLGLFLIFIHIAFFSSCLLYPVVSVFVKLDPFYYIFEFFLPPPNERCLVLICGTIFIRFVLSAVGAYEFLRFSTLHLFVYLSIFLTILTCLRNVIKMLRVGETTTLKLYIMLSIIMKTVDYFIRHVIAHLLFFCQILLVSTWWLVFKCYFIMPVIMTSVFGIAAVGTLIIIIPIISIAVEISNTSQQFVNHKKAMSHTFNRRSRKYYYYLKWNSQRILPMRFGTQFIIGVNTPISYLDVLMVNLTNAILLINP